MFLPLHVAAALKALPCVQSPAPASTERSPLIRKHLRGASLGDVRTCLSLISERVKLAHACKASLENPDHSSHPTHVSWWYLIVVLWPFLPVLVTWGNGRSKEAPRQMLIWKKNRSRGDGWGGVRTKQDHDQTEIYSRTWPASQFKFHKLLLN